MLVAVKGNREIKIDANEKKHYIENGHKIIEIDDKGKQKVVHDPAEVKAGKTDDKAIKQLEAALAEKDAKIAELEAALAEKDAKIAELEAALAEKDKK